MAASLMQVLAHAKHPIDRLATRQRALAKKALNDSPPALRGEMPQARGGLRSRLTGVAVPGQAGAPPSVTP